VATLLDSATGSFAYLTMRPTTPERQVFEFGAVAHGPEGAKTADQLVAAIQAWDHDYRGQKAELHAYPAGTPDDQLHAGRVLERTAFRFTIAWPSAQ
jgi:protein-L-isoaspartate(D-aspartate) O-methyltransferase